MKLTPEDCDAVRELLPHTAHALIQAIGAVAACALFNELPGVTIVVPKYPDANPAGARRWAGLAARIGETAMVQLASRWGGEALSIPLCRVARAELRARAIRAAFDELTLIERLSGKQATYEICLRFAPISSRQVELICGKSDEPTPLQAALF